ncbi:hypothetical protein F1559_005186 [Cyanidiococcus yangmingshanensis]|uniref:Uncharacterized protein n=1 Tax=Cyanidiococcus yangmingshanensis TaxID=2690220 RepID=A0A7J7IMA0_9RHOD|nr:hypothetical protein F1559_005186 [Cyanidiococcus yangmingshanensis]
MLYSPTWAVRRCTRATSGGGCNGQAANQERVTPLRVESFVSSQWKVSARPIISRRDGDDHASIFVLFCVESVLTMANIMRDTSVFHQRQQVLDPPSRQNTQSQPAVLSGGKLSTVAIEASSASATNS